MDAGFVVITRYHVEDVETWMPQARLALAPLVTQPQCAGGEIAGSIDDPHLMVITTRWPSVGDYRRAMSAFDVKLHTLPLLYQAIDEPTTFEVLHVNGPAGAVDLPSARAADAESVRLGEAASAQVAARLATPPVEA